MDLAWGTPETGIFITNVGLITTNGPHKHNIMACEWTHHVSHSPGLIAVCVGPKKATAENINETKEFGVSISSNNQNILSSISGSSSGRDTDKISVLKELGFEFFEADKINTLMVKGAALNVECKLKEKLEIGSHIIFIGEIVKIHELSGKKPLIFNSGRYYHFGEEIRKPSDEERENMKSLIEKHRKTQ